MTYELKKELKNNIEFLTLFSTENDEFLEIIPSLGGTVVQMGLRQDGLVRELLTPDPLPQVAKNPLFRGRFLFPFNDRIPGGSYTFAGTTHQLPINDAEDGSAIHGFIHDKHLEVLDVQTTDEHVSLTLLGEINEGDVPGYPFAVALRIMYTLRKGAIELAFKVENPGETSTPFSLGWHPYFTIDQAGTSLQASYEKYVEVDDKLLPTKNLITTRNTPYDFQSPASVNEMEIDLGFTMPTDGITRLGYKSYNVLIEQNLDLFKYTQLYIPDDKGSIAVEPITAPTNNFNFHELGLRVLKPGESTSGNVVIRLA